MDPSEYDTLLRVGTLVALVLGLDFIFLVLRFEAEPAGQAE